MKLVAVVVGLSLIWALPSLATTPPPEDRSVEQEVFAPAVPVVNGIKNVFNWLVDWFSPSHLRVVGCKIAPTLSKLPYYKTPPNCPTLIEQAKAAATPRPNPTYSPGRSIF